MKFYNRRKNTTRVFFVFFLTIVFYFSPTIPIPIPIPIPSYSVRLVVIIYRMRVGDFTYTGTTVQYVQCNKTIDDIFCYNTKILKNNPIIK
jgi:hypothetical protein